MFVIGIHGPSRSGKDSVYKILKEEFPTIKFERQGFADALKISAAKAISAVGDDDDLIDFMDLLKENGQIEVKLSLSEEENGGFTVSGRKFLQYYGTEAHREMFGDQFWLDQVIPSPWIPEVRADKTIRDCDVLVIPDVRYDNEVERISQCKRFDLWKVLRDDNGNTTGHASEANLLADWDVIIDNNGSYDKLVEQVVDNFQKTIGAEIAKERSKANG